MAKKKTKKPTFTHLNMPAKILGMRNLSLLEKVIICDIGHFNGNGYAGYTISNTDMGRKFGISRRAIINALNRLKSPKCGLIKDVALDNYHRCLKLNGEVSALFSSEKLTPLEPKKNLERPTAEQVTQYAASIDFELDGQHFVDYYEARGWMVGRTKMRSWKAAVRNWQNRRRQDASCEVREDTPVAEYVR